MNTPHAVQNYQARDSIIIEGLEVKTVIGCFAWERQIEQPLMLDVQLDCDLSKASESDALADTLNYAEICQICSETIQHAQPELIEHAAYLVIQALFAQFTAIEKISIHIRKPAIIPQAQSVGIRLVRERS
ncbi:MAG: dihydroneopterin aldolase [Acinetobacter sp.]|nr:dihydroneopterin aldolase [Acinetobacter sp.]